MLAQDTNSGAEVRNGDFRHASDQPRVLHTSGCKHPGEGPSDPSSRHHAAAVASAHCQGNAAADEDAADEDAAGRVR